MTFGSSPCAPTIYSFARTGHIGNTPGPEGIFEGRSRQRLRSSTPPTEYQDQTGARDPRRRPYWVKLTFGSFGFAPDPGADSMIGTEQIAEKNPARTIASMAKIAVASAGYELRKRARRMRAASESPLLNQAVLAAGALFAAIIVIRPGSYV